MAARVQEISAIVVTRNSLGFSLVECLVATALLATAVVSIGQLIAMSVGNAAVAHDTTFSTLIAQRKLEEWRSLPSVDLVDACVGQPVSSACVEYVDVDGRLVAAGGPEPPAGTAYVVRWSVWRSGDLWLMEARAARLRLGSAAWSAPPSSGGGVRFLTARFGRAE